MIDVTNKLLRKLPAWLVYLGASLYVAWLCYLGATGGLGPEPINALEREYGLLALQFVTVGLAVTPLRRRIGINLMKFRRAIGVSAFFIVITHLLVWLLLDLQSLERIWTDILKRPYITIGMLAFLLMLPLGVTSNNWSVRKLGLMWRTLHKLTYGVAVLGGVHFVMVTKGFQIEPLVYLGIIGVLLALRVKQFPLFKPAQNPRLSSNP